MTDARAPRIVIVGAGMAGILSAIELQEAGITDLAIYEKADRLGGTWRDNRYPGVACDVPSHLYRYSFAPNPDWTHTFASGGEILAYLEDVARSHDVERYVRYGAEVRRLARHDGRWHIETTRGERDEADVVIACTGVLHHPAYPDIDGLETFGGRWFHSARWEDGTPLEGRRVGVIGTGSTAVQIVSALVEEVAELRLFQRTPQWVLPLPNPEIPEAERARLRAEPEAMAELREQLSRAFEESFANAVVDADSPQVKLLEDMCRANLERVRDPELRERLRPTYRAACKRLVVSPDFYDAIQHPSARLVTTAIERVEHDGVRTVDGELHELDVLVLATGFRVDRFLRPMEVVGRDGLLLDEVWAQRPSAHLAVAVPGFPNLFLLNGPNGPVGNFSLIEVAELQLGYVMQLIELIRSGRCREVEVRKDVAEAWEAERVAAAERTVWVTGCRSWYLDDRGIPAAWPWTFDKFRSDMAAPRLEDYELT